MSSLKHTGSYIIQLSEGVVPATVVSDNFEMSYTDKQIYGFTFNGAHAISAVPQGTVTAPRLILVFLYSGSVELSLDTPASAPMTLTANPTPPVTDRPVFSLYSYAPPTQQWYISSSAAARGEIWLFQ